MECTLDDVKLTASEEEEMGKLYQLPQKTSHRIIGKHNKQTSTTQRRSETKVEGRVPFIILID